MVATRLKGVAERRPAGIRDEDLVERLREGDAHPLGGLGRRPSGAVAVAAALACAVSAAALVLLLRPGTPEQGAGRLLRANGEPLAGVLASGARRPSSSWTRALPGLSCSSCATAA